MYWLSIDHGKIKKLKMYESLIFCNTKQWKNCISTSIETLPKPLTNIPRPSLLYHVSLHTGCSHSNIAMCILCVLIEYSRAYRQVLIRVTHLCLLLINRQNGKNSWTAMRPAPWVVNLSNHKQLELGHRLSFTSPILIKI